VQFVVGPANTQGAAHTLVAHFPFEAGSGPVLAAATDASGHGYNMTYDGGYGAQGGVGLVSDSAAGLGAARFHDGDGNSAGALGWAEPAPPALLAALAGSFSVSCWIKTTQNNFGSDTATASQGAGIVSADTGMTTNDVLPMALTGDVIGFNIGGSSDVTLNSSGRVNDGVYHHVAVTRNQRTGQMTLYLDGVLDGFTCGSTNLLNAPQKLTIGALAAAANPDPNDGSYHHGYDGELDDLQIYSGVLSAAEIANLHAHPGSTIADLLPLPVNPSGVMAGAGNFQFRFQSQAPFVHAVEYRTNLVSGAGWQTYSNVTGDGTIKTISIPLAVFGPAGQGYVRVSTQ